MQEVRLQFANENFRMREAFRTLRSNVEFSGQDVRVISVTSCTPSEGKTSCAVDLARAFAESGKRTILIDADLRKSVMIARYKTGGVRLGLTHYLVGQECLDRVICQSDVPGLYLIFAGPVPPNPGKLLGSELFEEMLKTLRKDFAYVIIDTPPLGSVIDAAIAARQSDGTILIIENNAVGYRFAQRIREQLDAAGAKTLGVVLNKVNLSRHGYYGHYGSYYGKYYGKYYGTYGSEDEATGERTGERGGGRKSAGENKSTRRRSGMEYVRFGMEEEDRERL